MMKKSIRKKFLKYSLISYLVFISLWGIIEGLNLFPTTQNMVYDNFTQENNTIDLNLDKIQNDDQLSSPKPAIDQGVNYLYPESQLSCTPIKFHEGSGTGNLESTFFIAATYESTSEFKFQFKVNPYEPISNVYSIRITCNWYVEHLYFWDEDENFNSIQAIFYLNGIATKTIDIKSHGSLQPLLNGDKWYRYTCEFTESVNSISFDQIVFTGFSPCNRGATFYLSNLFIKYQKTNTLPRLIDNAKCITGTGEVGSIAGLSGYTMDDPDSTAVDENNNLLNTDHNLHLTYDWFWIDAVGTEHAIGTTATVTISSLYINIKALKCIVIIYDKFGRGNAISDTLTFLKSIDISFNPVLGNFEVWEAAGNEFSTKSRINFRLNTFQDKGLSYVHDVYLYKITPQGGQEKVGEQLNVLPFTDLSFELNKAGRDGYVYPNDIFFLHWYSVHTEPFNPSNRFTGDIESTHFQVINNAPSIRDSIHLVGGISELGYKTPIMLAGPDNVGKSSQNILELFQDPDDMDFEDWNKDLKIERLEIIWKIDRYTPRLYENGAWINNPSQYIIDYTDLAQKYYSLPENEFNILDKVSVYIRVTDATGATCIPFPSYSSQIILEPQTANLATDSEAFQTIYKDSMGDNIFDFTQFYADSQIGLTFRAKLMGYFPTWKINFDFQVYRSGAWWSLLNQQILSSEMEMVEFNPDSYWTSEELDRQYFILLDGLELSFKKGDKFRVELYLYDQLNGYQDHLIKNLVDESENSVIIANYIPTIENLKFETPPSAAGSGAKISADIIDIDDGDIITLSYTWKVRGEVIPITSDEIPASSALTEKWAYTRGDKVECTITSKNKNIVGENSATISYIVGNAAPFLNISSIQYMSSLVLYSKQDFIVNASIEDYDNTLSRLHKDDVDYKVYWMKNDKLLTVTSNGERIPYQNKILSSSFFRRGDRIQAIIEPFDIPLDNSASLKGNTYWCPIIYVGNSLPQITSLALELKEQYMDDNITIIADAIDHDDDAITYEVKWYVNNKLVRGIPLNQTTLTPDYFAAGDLVTFEIRAHDGLEGGPWVSSNEIQIAKFGRYDAVDLAIFSRLTPMLWALFFGTIIGTVMVVQIQAKRTEKKSGKRQAIEASVIVSAVVTLYAMVNAGVLIPLNPYKIDGINLPQLIFMEMLAVGFGLIMSNFVQGFYSIGDTYKKGSEFLSDIGARPSDSQSMQKAMFDAAKRPFQTQRISVIIANASNSDLAAIKTQLPSPKDLTAIVQSALKDHAVMGLYELSTTPPINNVYIKVIPAVEETETRYMETLSTYRKKMGLLFYSIVAIFAISVIVWKFRPDPII